MTIEDVDFQKLSASYNNNDVVKAIIAWLCSRVRDPRRSETKAGNLLDDLAKRGESFTINEIRGALDEISKSGCGKYQVGRPIENSRIEWQCSARELAEIVLEEAGNVGMNRVTGTNEEDDKGIETHFFPVRPGISLPVKVRTDMTADELQNMSEFLQLIAKSRGTNGITQ